jgi:DNA-binding NarL/FixJ family response regulator
MEMEVHSFVQERSRTAVVLDRHPLWAEAVDGVLRRVGITTVGKATTGSEALAVIQRVSPDVLVTDIAALDGDDAGLSCLREARRLNPGLRGIVLSLSEEARDIEAALAAGATAYVFKTAHPDDLASAVRQAFEHSVYLASSVEVGNGHAGQVQLSAENTSLTKREREILRLVAEGHSNAQLAKMLWVTEQTIKFHLSNVYKKLKVSNRTEAARWAQVHGLAPTPAHIIAA